MNTPTEYTLNKTLFLALLATACDTGSEPDASQFRQLCNGSMTRTANNPQAKAWNASTGASTAGALVASGLTAKAFFTKVTPNQAAFVPDQNKFDMLKSACKNVTNALHPNSTWPEKCDFGGFVNAMNYLFDSDHWVGLVKSETQQSAAVSEMIHGFLHWGSPAFVPLYGVADHWATVIEITFGCSTLNWVKFRDTGKIGATDSKGNSYIQGTYQVSGEIWKLVYYQVLSIADPADPYRKKFLLAYEPPVQSSNAEPAPESLNVEYWHAPGVVEPEETVSAALAEERVVRALADAGLADDPLYVALVEHGRARGAHLVKGADPSGAPWTYYVVPLHGPDGGLAAIVQLAEVDLSIQQIFVPENVQRHAGLDATAARRLAGEQLTRGEVLGAGVLTWDAADKEFAEFSSSPVFPYYAYPVLRGGEPCGHILVYLHDGAAARTGAR